VQASTQDAAEADDSTSLIPLGIALGSFGSVGINLGNNLQALGITMSMDQIAQHKDSLAEWERGGANPNTRPQEPPKSARGKVVFVLGTTIFVCSSLINFVAFAFAPASILAPLEAIQVVCQLFMGRILRGIPITRLAALSTVLTCAGVIGAVAAVPPKVYEFTVPQLVQLWREELWIGYLIAVLACAAALYAVHVMYLRRELQRREADEAGQAVPPSLPLAELVTPLTYSTSSAILGALSVAQAKAVSELVTLLFPPCFINVFTEPFLYMTLFLLAAAGGIWLRQSVAALSLYEANFIIPMLQANYIVFATISGGVFFQEFGQMRADAWRWPLFAGGIFTMVCGLGGLFSAGIRAERAAATVESLRTRFEGSASGPDAHSGASGTCVQELASSPSAIIPTFLVASDVSPSTPSRGYAASVVARAGETWYSPFAVAVSNSRKPDSTSPSLAHSHAYTHAHAHDGCHSSVSAPTTTAADAGCTGSVGGRRRVMSTPVAPRLSLMAQHTPTPRSSHHSSRLAASTPSRPSQNSSYASCHSCSTNGGGYAWRASNAARTPVAAVSLAEVWNLTRTSRAIQTGEPTFNQQEMYGIDACVFNRPLSTPQAPHVPVVLRPHVHNLRRSMDGTFRMALASGSCCGGTLDRNDSCETDRMASSTRHHIDGVEH